RAFVVSPKVLVRGMMPKPSRCVDCLKVLGITPELWPRSCVGWTKRFLKGINGPQANTRMEPTPAGPLARPAGFPHSVNGNSLGAAHSDRWADGTRIETWKLRSLPTL